VLQEDSDLEQRILDSALSQFPIIGDQLSDPQGLQGNRTAVVIGGLVALYGALGVAQALQNAMNVAWSVPRNRRPNPVKARLRSLLLIGTAGIAVLATTILSALGGSAAASGTLFSGWVALLVTAAAVVVNAAIFMAAFRISTATKLSVRDVAPGAIIAAVIWQLLQLFGTAYVAHVAPARMDLPGGPRRRAERRDQRRTHQAPVSTRLTHPVHRQRRSHPRRSTRLHRRGDGPAAQRFRVCRRHLRPRRAGGLGTEAGRQRAGDE
jgi:Virulence factor BrkB